MLIGFIAILILYCVIHSILADPDIMGELYVQWWFRFFYVAQSVILFIPVYWQYLILPSEPFFDPGILLRIALMSVWMGGLIFGLYAVRSYDNMSFLGITQLRKGLRGGEAEYQRPKLTKKGALGIVRHPYYFTALLLIWARPMAYKDLYMNIVLTIYFLLGTINEERKLRKEFGQEYADYSKDVPALIPFMKLRKR